MCVVCFLKRGDGVEEITVRNVGGGKEGEQNYTSFTHYDTEDIRHCITALEMREVAPIGNYSQDFCDIFTLFPTVQ